ncbi:aldo/keto reductase [Streptomyces sp. NPDC001404]|uniref:aldo/keto reductase n=1 Tax=Streptomyces sp. NPDC001404 TaxID=3364571 RepID=UPI003697B192
MTSPFLTASRPMPRRRSGRSGLYFPLLGLSIGWQTPQPAPICRSLLVQAVGLGITHFDITVPCSAPPTAEGDMAHVLAPVKAWRERLLITARIGLGTRGGHIVGFGSRKHLLSSLDALLRNTGLDYIDVLYAHRYDCSTPLEETTTALASAVRQGKALYAGLSSYSPSFLHQAAALMQNLGTPVVSYQASYSLLDRWIEGRILDILDEYEIGCTACSPLAHSALVGARALHTPSLSSSSSSIAPALLQLAAARGQSPEQLAISWVLHNPRITSTLITTSHIDHLTADRHAVDCLDFDAAELNELNICCPSPFGTPRPTPKAPGEPAHLNRCGACPDDRVSP